MKAPMLAVRVLYGAFLATQILSGMPLYAAEPSYPENPAVVSSPVSDGLPKPDKIIAVIEGEPLTLRDFEQHLSGSGVPLPAEGTDEFRKLYEEYLSQQLIEKEAKALGIDVLDEDINLYYDEVRKQNGVSEADFTKILESKGITLTSYRSQIRQEILRTRLVQQHARSTISVSDKDVQKHLGVEDKESETESMLHLYQVFVPLREDGESSDFKLSEGEAVDVESKREARREIAEKIQEKVSSPEDLQRAGGTYFSDLGVISADDLLIELRETVEDLDEGEVSSLVETDRGFYLLGLRSVKEDASGPKEEVRDRAKKELFEGKLKDEMQSFLSKELPKKYNLERRL